MLPTVVHQTLPSVVQLQYPHSDKVCTAFSIAPGVYLTADHCLLDETNTIEGHDITVVMRDHTYDIAVLRAGVVRPVLLLGDAPVLGESVVFVGFAYSFPTPTVRHSLVSALVEIRGTMRTAYDNAAIGGMSGGPVIDASGRVVGIVQASNRYAMVSLVHADLVRLVGDYWQDE